MEFDKNLFENVYRIAKGNAGLTKAIIAKALSPEYHSAGHVNLDLIMIDIKMGKVW